MKIDYTNFLKKYRTEETDKGRIAAMHKELVHALRQLDVHGKVRATYYTDGCVKVELNGEYLNMFCSVSKKWFSGVAMDFSGEKHCMEKEHLVKDRSALTDSHIVADPAL